MASRSSLLQTVSLAVFLAGAVIAVAANKLGRAGLQDAGIVVVFVAVVLFGLDMVVQRRAEMSTRYSSSVNPSFHVFRGVGGAAWGVAFVLAGLLLGGYALITLTRWTAAKAFLANHDGVVVTLAGLLVTAVGVGGATRATYRHRDDERPARRLADRLAAVLVIIPFGVTIVTWGLLRTFAPSTEAAITAAIKAAIVRLVTSIMN